MFQRVLFIWSMRHPASGYVQGINDLLTPFFVVFLSEHCKIGEKFMNFEIQIAVVFSDTFISEIISIDANGFSDLLQFFICS